MKLFNYTSLFLSVVIICCNQRKSEVKDFTLNEIDSLHGIPPFPPPPVKSSEYLITDTSFGRINRSTDLKKLIELFGRKNIIDGVEYGAEGQDSFMMTHVYPNTFKEIIISWKPKRLHKEIVSAECFADNSPYHTSDSLKVGSTLQKLLQVNRKPINFYGMDWDYGGTITSFNKGKFEGANISFQLGDNPGMSEKLMGDKEFNTAMPLVKSNLKKLRIAVITLSFNN